MARNKIIALFATCVLLAACGGGPRGAGDFEVWGLDVSKYQSDADWRALCRHDKPDFVFVKATEGSMIADPHYGRHVRELDRHGVLRGAYHFFGHRTGGKVQAAQFIKTAGLGPGNLWPVLDIERNRLMTDPARSVREAAAFCREIKKEYGVYPIIYCSAHFYGQYLKKEFPADRYTLWIADYRGEEPGAVKWTFWQHTDTHKIRGIKGHVDRNVFRGRSDDLEKYILK